MRLLQSLTISAKMALLLTVSFVMLTVGLVTAGIQIFSLQTSIITLQTNHLPSVENINAMRASLADFRVIEYRHVVSTDITEMNEAETLLAAERAKFLQYEESYKLLISNAEEQALFQQYKEHEALYLNAHIRILELSRSLQNEEAKKMVLALDKTHYMACILALQKLVNFNLQLAQTERENSTTKVQQSFFFLVLSILVLALSFVMQHRLFRQLIVKPLTEVQSAIQAAAAGDLSAQVHYEQTDEIGDLASSFNAMLLNVKDSQERIIAQNEEIARQQRIMGVQSQYLERANSSLRQNNVDLREFMQREYLRIEEMARHKDILVELAKREEIHSGNLADAFTILTESGAKQIDASRVSIWLLRKRSFMGKDNTSALELQDLFDVVQNIHIKDKRLTADDFPIFFEALFNLDVIAAADTSHDENTREFTTTNIFPDSTFAMLHIPLRMGSNFIGVITAEHHGSQRTWTIAEQVFLRSLGTFVTVALDAAEKNNQRALLGELNRELLLVNTDIQEKNIALQKAQEISLEAIKFINDQNVLLENKTEELAALNGELQERNAMLADANSVLADAYKQIQRQNERWERLTIERAAQINSLTDRNAELQQTYAELNEAYSEIKRQNDLLEQQARQAAAMSQLLNDQNTRLQETNSELAKTYSEIRRQNELLQDQARAIEEANTQLQEKNVELSKAGNEKNEMLGIVAHDLRNPLASIMLAASIIRRSIERTGECPPSELVRYMGRIEETSERMNTIISELLDLNALETGNMRIAKTDIDLNALARLVYEDFGKRSESKNITLHFSLPQRQIKTLTDGRLLRQVLENIVSNALKYSPPHKNVWFSLDTLEEGSNSFARFSIRDEGPGISASDQAHLFKKFTRLSAKPTAGEQSTGLGLSIVKKFSEALGGTVRCESSPETGKSGATFIFDLPVITPEPSM